MKFFAAAALFALSASASPIQGDEQGNGNQNGARPNKGDFSFKIVAPETRTRLGNDLPEWHNRPVTIKEGHVGYFGGATGGRGGRGQGGGMGDGMNRRAAQNGEIFSSTKTNGKSVEFVTKSGEKLAFLVDGGEDDGVLPEDTFIKPNILSVEEDDGELDNDESQGKGFKNGPQNNFENNHIIEDIIEKRAVQDNEDIDGDEEFDVENGHLPGHIKPNIKNLSQDDDEGDESLGIQPLVVMPEDDEEDDMYSIADFDLLDMEQGNGRIWNVTVSESTMGHWQVRSTAEDSFQLEWVDGEDGLIQAQTAFPAEVHATLVSSS